MSDDGVGQRPGPPSRPSRRRRGSAPCPTRAKPTHQNGRPSTLTPQLEADLVAQVKRVGVVSLAARCCGLSIDTVEHWLSRGRGTHRNGLAPTPATVRFARAIEKARAEFLASRVEIIEAAGHAKPECWTSAAWMLERMEPDTWGRRDRVDVSGTITVVEVRALLVAMLGVLERYVPSERRETEFANLLAEARKLGPAGGGSVVSVPSAGA